MSKKTPKTDSNTESSTLTEGRTSAAPIDISSPVIQQAIAEGRALIEQGKSKADAARAIYAAIRAESKDVVVAAFVEGATLTPKGALTYWYNCERKAAKEMRRC